MKRSARSQRMPLSLLLYRLALRAYPAAFRRAFGEELWQTFRDAYEEANPRGIAAVALLWLHSGIDILRSAIPERSNAMRPAVLLTTILTGIAFVISFIASFNLYGLEDQNLLTGAAYQASPLLRLTYDGSYISALVAGVALCAILAYAIFPTNAHSVVPIGLALLALLVVLGGFGGLLIRYPQSFLAIFLFFAVLALASFFCGRIIAARLQPRLGQRAAAIIGACVSMSIVLLVNVLALGLHTLALNPTSHALYMQGQIAGTHVNTLVIGVALQLLTFLICIISLVFALRSPASHRVVTQ